MSWAENLDDERLQWVPFKEAHTPPAGIIMHIKDAYWTAHPERGILFFLTWNRGKIIHTSPQFNKEEDIAKHFLKLYPAGCIVSFESSVFYQVDINDYT